MIGGVNIQPNDPETGSLSPRFESAKLFLQKLDSRLLYFILSKSAGARGRSYAIAISKIGNGWFYFVFLPLVFLYLPDITLTVLAVALANIGLTHSIYPFIKRRIARPRPFATDPSLRSLLKVKDQHSFPSGHTMTLMATLAPITYVHHAFWLPGIVMLAIMSWARIASAHHYPSDVLAGIAFGAALGYILPLALLAPQGCQSCGSALAELRSSCSRPWT